jgi:hypothetical protein
MGFEDSYGFAVSRLVVPHQHLPQGTPRAAPSTAAATQDWDQVDAQVSSGVLMILKKK